jgi:K+-sensing histidine kinase KdpD
MDEMLERLPPTTWAPLARGAALVAPLIAGAILYSLRDDIASATGALVLVLIVVGAAATGDRPAGLLAAVSAGAWFDFFLAPPYLTFTIRDADDVETAVLLVLISAAVTEVALWGRRQQARASRRSGYLDGVVSAARSVADGTAPRSAVTAHVAAQIADVLDADSARFVAGPVHDVRIAVLDHDGVLVRRGRPVDVDRAGLPTDEYVAVPVRKGTHDVGHFLVTSASGVAYPTHEQLRVAVLLADQVAAMSAADA